MTQLEPDKLNTYLDLSPLEGARVLMTGASGFVGHSMLEVLHQNIGKLDIMVYAVTRDPLLFIAKSPELARHDSTMLWQGSAAHCPNANFTHIVHLENCDSKVTSLMAHRAALRKAPMLFASSGAMYGSSLPMRVDENYTPAPSSHYGWSKWFTESQCRNIADYAGARFIAARMFAFSGRYLPLEPFAVGNFVANGLRREAICVNGDGSAVRSYLDSADLGRWLWTLLMHGRGAYNVGSEQAITVRELAYKVSNHFGYSPEIVLKHDPDVPSTVYVSSTQRAQSELGLAQVVTLDESIDRMIEYNTVRAGE